MCISENCMEILWARPSAVQHTLRFSLNSSGGFTIFLASRNTQIVGLVAICWTIWKLRNRACFECKLTKTHIELISYSIFLQNTRRVYITLPMQKTFVLSRITSWYFLYWLKRWVWVIRKVARLLEASNSKVDDNRMEVDDDSWVWCVCSFSDACSRVLLLENF
jgi:hypothetical protein